MSITDYADWNEPQAHATAIAVTGVPLLSVPSTLIQQVLQVIAANGTVTYGPVSFTQPGWAAQFVVQASASATVPYVEVKFLWGDAVTGLVYSEDHVILPGGAPATSITVLAQGVAQSSQLTVTVTNLDPAQSVTVSTEVAQDSVVRSKDRWRWRNFACNGAVIPGATLATLPDDEACLGFVDNLTLPASTTVTRLFAMHEGLIAVAYQLNTGSPSSLVIDISPVPFSAFSAHAITFSQVGPPASFQVGGCRAPLQVNFHNLATTAAAITCGLFAIP